MKFSLFYFDGDGSARNENAYQLLMDSAKFADKNGFAALWLPERHFHAFGGLYPSPAVIHAALSQVTKNVHLRAGSVVAPLHHPVRVAEEWSVLDNLSGGRAGIAVAAGWTMPEFIMSREPHGLRRSLMWQNYEAIRKLLPTGPGDKWSPETKHLLVHAARGTEHKMVPPRLHIIFRENLPVD